MASISEYNPLASIEYLTQTPEHQYLERKGVSESGIKPTRVADEIIGMLNADGGILALGITDDGIVEDLNSLDSGKLNEYRVLVNDLIKPPAYVKLEEVTHDGKLFFLYHVDQDYERMYSRKDNEKVFRRIADQNKGPLNLDEITKLQYDKSMRSFEDTLRDDFDLDDIDTPTLDKYRETLAYEGTNEELLLKRNLAKKIDGKLVFKNSAILLFAMDPDKYITSSYVRYVRYEGDEAKSGKEFNVTKDEKFFGNIPNIIDAARKFIYASLDDFYYLNFERGRFISVSEYPEEAWLEAIVNALFHRSYNLQGNCIYIRHYDDRLEISNSGPLPAQVTLENIRRERFSRNPRIGRVLSEMGYVRELNEGVNRIYRSMEKSMLSEPVYRDQNDTVTLLLINKIAKHEKSIPNKVLDQVADNWKSFNDTERKIINYMFSNFIATVIDLMAHLDVSETTIRNNLANLIKLEILEKQSEKQRDINAIYRFKKN